MKRFKLMLFMLVFIGYAYADDVLLLGEEEGLENDGGGVDPSSAVKRPNRSPLRSAITICGNIIYFITPCENCTLYVYNEDDDLVYMAVIPNGAVTFTLPPQFSGNYKIVFTDGDLYYEQNVSLYFMGLQ